MAARLDKLARAQLYFVCEAGDDPAALEHTLEAALRGGVNIVQLRDHDASDDELLAAAPIFRTAADRHDALFILNDRPDLVAAAGADGVHVGQDDTPVAEARAAAGEGAIVGLSSHGPEQLAAALEAQGAARPDHLSVGPVWATPTKPGRPAAGLDYVRHAAANAGDLPWFAIGGIDAGNIGEVAAAGASRVVVVRALRDAPDPEAVARELRAALPTPVETAR
ncbi:MAG: thiamine phosphate synthase [Solirubrobacterales bacterium]